MSQLTSEALQLRLEVSQDDLIATLGQLTQLKVPQLKELCKSIGLTQKGKKQDLIDRLHQFISSCSRVRDRSYLLLAVRTIVLKALNNDPVPNFSNLCNVLSTGLIDHQLITGQIARIQNSLALGSSQRNANHSHGSQSMTSNVRSSHSTQLSAYYPKYQGPMLLFQSTIFYTLRRMVHGFPYVMTASMGRNVCNVPVHLDKDEINTLQQSSTAKIYFFCALSSTPNPNNAEILFPPIEIYVDGVNTKQYVKGLKGKAGTCRPADLTSYIKDINRQFTINIVYSDAAEPYIVYLYIVDARSPEAIAKMIVQSLNFIPASTTRDNIRKEYEQNQDDDIVMATSSISLRCPLSYARMTYPVKSIQCDHIQCFDALSFLSMQERIPSWICPVCSATINQQLLALSKYMEDILMSTSDEVDTVTLNPDGSWVIAEEGAEDTSKPKAQNFNKPVNEGPATSAEPASNVDDAIEIISLGSDSEDEHAEVTISAAPPEPHNSNTSFAMRSITPEGLNPVNASSNASAHAHIATDSASVNEGPTNPEMPSTDVPIQESTAVHQDIPIAQTTAEISSDDEPIHNYSRRRNNMIEEQAIYITSSPSPSVLHHSSTKAAPQSRTPSDEATMTTLSHFTNHTENHESEGIKEFATAQNGAQNGEITSNNYNYADSRTGHASGMNDALKSQQEKARDSRVEIANNESGRPTSSERTAIASTHQAYNTTEKDPPSININIENGQGSGSLPLPSGSSRGTFATDANMNNIASSANHDALFSTQIINGEQNGLDANLGATRHDQPAPENNSHPPLAWMNLMINPEVESNPKDGSIINTIQKMFSRSASPHLLAPSPDNSGSENQRDPESSNVISNVPTQTNQHPELDRSTSRESDQNTLHSALNGSNGPKDVLPPHAAQDPTASSQSAQLPTGASATKTTYSNPVSGSSSIGNLPTAVSSKADAYRKTIQNTSHLISLYRQMERAGSQGPMQSHDNRTAFMRTDSTISFSSDPGAQANSQDRGPARLENTPTWNTASELGLSHIDSRTRSVPTLPSKAWSPQAAPGAPTNRYSISPFDTFREAEQEKQKVRGILDIEVAHDVILPWNSPSRGTGGNLNGMQDGPASHVTAERQIHGASASRLLYNLPGVSNSTSTAALSGGLDDFPTSSPIGKKRSISGSSQQRTWNKRLNKQKFNPSEINDGQVIELDD